MIKSLIKITTFLTASTFLLSCGKTKKDEVSPNVSTEQVDNSVERYFPLAIGNKWSYQTPSYSYDVTITGKKTVGSAEYYDGYNSYSKTSGYIRYQDGKYYNIGTPTGSTTTVELLFLDERAKVGDKWKMGEITVNQSGITSTTTYNCEVVSRPATYKIGTVTYNDIFVVKTETSLKYTLGPPFTQYLTAEQIATYESYYNNLGTLTSQLSYYARGVGFIQQTSESMPSLNTDMVSYSLVGR